MDAGRSVITHQCTSVSGWFLQRDARRAAVCPVCAAMPWGDAAYVSPDLVQHATVRHRFDYDTTTDFDQDEDAVLRQVLARSLTDT